MLFKTFLLSAALALGLPILASAATIHATEVTAFLGTQSTGDRRVAPNALGAPDGTFLSLGFGGAAVFGFGQAFTGPATILEVTWGGREGHLESARVYVGNLFSAEDSAFRPSDFTVAGDITNAGESSRVAFDGTWAYLAILDTSPRVNGRDGFDIDAVSVSGATVASPARVASTLAPVPLPASALLLLGGMAVLTSCRRRTAG